MKSAGSCFEREWQTLKHNTSFVFGLALYVGEGSKCIPDVAFVNCDPDVHRAFVRFLQLLGYESTRLSVLLYLHRGDDSDAARKFWVEKLGIPASRFTRDVFVTPRSASGKRIRMQPNGTCRVRVRRSTELSIKLRTWMSLALSEYGRVAEAPLFQSG